MILKKPKQDLSQIAQKLFREDGNTANSKEHPDCLADCFEKKQWGIDNNRNKDVRTTKLFNFMSDINIGKITMEELMDTVKLFKNKSPGPDGIPVEFFKWLIADGLNCILEILNEGWENNVLPEHMELANVVTL